MTDTIGYLDLPSGLSGDMLLGCLVDAGWPIDDLRRTIGRLGLPADQWSIEARSVMKGSLRATHVEVRAAEGPRHRTLADVTRMIEGAELPAAVTRRAVAVFTRLAEAEARVHGTTPQKIHFHEVGAVDALIDVVAGCAGVAALGIDALYASAVPLAGGWADTAHGRIPLPAPATLELLAAAGAPSRPAPGEGEWLTPTGAALLGELARFEQPVMSIDRVGVGAGERDCAWPNIARLWVGRAEAQGNLLQLETNIDDMNPQLFAAVSDRLLAAGARDVWMTPVQMKKGRPAVVLSALAPAACETRLVDILLRETTTLGVRVSALMRRPQARREIRRIETPYGEVRVKLKWVDHDLVGAAPEYDDCARLAGEAGVPIKRVHDAASAAAHGLVARFEQVETPGTVPGGGPEREACT